MMEALADREAGLEAARAELERRVEERTQSLRHEVTERRQAEEALRIERSALKSLLENIRAVPWEMDPDSGACRYVGPQVERLWGWPADAFAASGFLHSCLREDDRAAFAAALARLPRAREVEIEFRLRRRSGEEVHVRSLLSHGIESGGRRATIHGISIDVTEQRRLEAKLQQAQKLESVGRLAAGVAHEINTPVQYVNDNCHFVRDALSDLSALLLRYRETLETLAPSTGDAQAALEAMRASEEEMDAAYLLENMLPAMERSIEGLERVAVIVRSMKEFAHPDQKQIVQADLNRAIESTLTIARNEYKYVADVKTELGQLPPVPCFLGDLNQAILNIVVNAAHAIGEVARESGRRGLITVRTEAHADCVSIRISDTGCGMPEHVRARIFDPFFTTKEVGKGTGQGLAIVHSVIVDRHGGSIDVDSEPGKGSTFTITLPLRPARPQPGVAHETAEAASCDASGEVRSA
ncbi:MAG: sensor histidine kinase [Gammaproteobacteria bacterium]